MYNRKWKMIAAFAMSFSVMLSASGLGTAAFAEEGKSTQMSTLDIAGADEASEDTASGNEEGSLLDLADSAAGDAAEGSESDDGLLALIDGGDDAQDAAGEEEHAEAAPEAEPAPAPQEAAPQDEEVSAEPAPADENGATLETAAGDQETETEAQQEEVHYEKLQATGSITEGISAVDVTSIVEAAMPSVVAVTATSVQKVRNYFSNDVYEIEGVGAGSGVIISQNDTELLIATNHHITKDSKDLTVCFSVDAEDEEDLIAPAVLKGESNKEDIAVIAVKLADIKPEVYSQLKVATLGSSSDLKVGEAAIVIGNALGFGQAAFSGIVSALDREVVTELGTFREFMIDAPVNLGCSGGAILNIRGEVIGFVNAKDTADYAESMGYGVPVDQAIPILQDLINRETRETVENHGYLGVTVVPVSEEAREMYGMPAGAYVYEVTEGSAAEAAGIPKGAIITTFDGLDVSGSDDLVNLVSHYEAGETVKVGFQVAEGGAYAEKEVDVTLQEGTEEAKKADEEAAGEDQQKPEDGADLDGQNPEAFPEGELEGTDPYGRPDEYGYYDGREGGYQDPFEWFFGDNDRGNDDGWGSFFFGN